MLTDELVEAAAGRRRSSRSAGSRTSGSRYFAEASVVFLDLPDAVFRGYEGDEELLGAPRDDDRPPIDDRCAARSPGSSRRRCTSRSASATTSTTSSAARSASRCSPRAARWVMPGPDYAGIVTFYEDFPYAWWNDFSRLEDLPAGALDDLPADVSLTPDYADISDQLERKISGITLYESQLDRLFGGPKRDGRDGPRPRPGRSALLGGLGGSAERYWSTKSV